MVGRDGAFALPWTEPALQAAIGAGRAHHAWLVQGPEGVGQFEFALALAQAWLCEAAESVARPCGGCASCRLVQARNHPDLLVLLPEALQEALGWSRDDDADAAPRAERKPSKEIKVDAVRRAVAFAQLTSARGRAKVVLIHPAERLNPIASNTLLKTLEEPPGGARFILATGAPQTLLPTVRSRCRTVALAAPEPPVAKAWLDAQGVAGAATLLAAAGGQPLLAKAWADEGLDAESWKRLPADVAAGRTGSIAAWPAPRAIDALSRLCHDALATSTGAAPRYFEAVPPAADIGALRAWWRELIRAAEHAEHPLNAGLLVESLVAKGRRAWPAAGGGRGPSLHSRA